MKVIFHISEPTRWSTVMSNIPNFLEQAQREGTQAKVELVINSDAISDAVQGSDIDLSQLVDLGVTVAACNNSMNGHNITKDQLQAGLVVVPAGVYELAKRQSEGYAYIKS